MASENVILKVQKHTSNILYDTKRVLQRPGKEGEEMGPDCLNFRCW